MPKAAIHVCTQSGSQHQLFSQPISSTSVCSVDCNVPSDDYSELILKLVVITQTHINFESNQTHNSHSLR